MWELSVGLCPKKYLLLLDQTILLQFRSSINRPLNLPQYPGRKYIINNWGLMKKNYFGWSGVYFIFVLHLYITVTCWHTIVFYGKHCFSNIKTSSKRLEYLNIFPSFFKKFNTSWNQYLCFIYFNNLVKYLSVARLRRCLISSKTVEISWAKFQEIQKTNNAHDVTMTSNTFRFCWKQVLTSKVWCRL